MTGVELSVGVPHHEGIVLGAFQRRVEVDGPVIGRRASGGPAVLVGPGSVWIKLVLPRPDALVPCDASKIVNRYVRPLLRATGAAFFGRDWISYKSRPVGFAGFAHDASTGATVFEAIMAAKTPFATDARAAFLGKEPATLDRDPGELADRIIAAYRELANDLTVTELPALDAVTDEPPWQATRPGAIGLVGAGRDRNGSMRVGGEFMASRDAIADLEARIGWGEDPDAALASAFADPNRVLFGAKAETLRDVLLEAAL